MFDFFSNVNVRKKVFTRVSLKSNQNQPALPRCLLLKLSLLSFPLMILFLVLLFASPLLMGYSIFPFVISLCMCATRITKGHLRYGKGLMLQRKQSFLLFAESSNFLVWASQNRQLLHFLVPSSSPCFSQVSHTYVNRDSVILLLSSVWEVMLTGILLSSCYPLFGKWC